MIFHMEHAKVAQTCKRLEILPEVPCLISEKEEGDDLSGGIAIILYMIADERNKTLKNQEKPTSDTTAGSEWLLLCALRR